MIKKLLSLIALSVALTGCVQPLPTSETEFVKYFDVASNKVVSTSIYTAFNNNNLYAHYMCVEGDALRVIRNREVHNIVDVYTVGKNCVEYHIKAIDKSKLDEVRNAR